MDHSQRPSTTNKAFIVRSNVQAVSLIRQHKAEDAAVLLRRALRVLLRRFHQEVAKNRSLKTPRLNPFGRSLRNQSPLCTIPLSRVRYNVETLVSPDGTFEVYNHIFQIALDDEVDLSLHSKEEIAVASAMVLYNIGLCLHRSALEKGQIKHLEAALTVYRKGWTMLTNHCAIDPKDVGARILIMALCNNMGHIYSLLFNSDAARRQREILSAAVASFSVSERVSFGLIFRFFSMGVAYFHTVIVANAPAA